MMNRIINMTRKHDGLIVSLILFVIYFLIVLLFDYLQYQSSTMFLTPDSRSYRSVGNWLFGLGDTSSTLVRPFLYPLILNLSRSFAGIYGIWCYQVLLWILSGVVLYKSIYKATNNIVLSIVGGLVYASNLTLLLLTLHALTEVTVIFLITVLIFVIISKQKYQNDYYWPLVVFIVSLLTTAKPVFMVLLFAILVYRIVALLLNVGKEECSCKLFIYIALALCPVLVQLSIMKVKYNEFTISEIGARTAKYYYFAEVYGEVNNISLLQAREYLYENSFSQKEVYKYLWAHYKVSVHTYFSILEGNLLAASNYVNYPTAHIYLSSYMTAINRVYFIFHVFMMPYSGIVLIIFFKKKHWADWEMVFCLMFPIWIIFLTSGITFGQGDRIILPSLPLWITLYSVTISKGWDLIRGNPLTMRISNEHYHSLSS